METSSDTLRRSCRALALSGLLLTACGGGNGTSAPAFNATGYWQTTLTDPSSGDETGPYGSYLMQSGSLVDGVAVTGSVAGNLLDMDVLLPGLPSVLEFTGTLSGQQVTGFYTLFGFPLSAAFRMQPFTPTGLVTANGTVGGLAVNVNTTTAFGERKYSDEALTMLTGVDVVHDDGTIRFEIEFDPTSLAVGVLDASVESVGVYAGDDNDEFSTVATSGSVTITQYDAGGFVATFNLTLPSAQSITGSFDVAYDLEAYAP